MYKIQVGDVMADRHSPGYVNAYKRENYDRVSFEIRKGKKQVLKDLSDRRGESMTQIIVNALESYYGITLTD